MPGAVALGLWQQGQAAMKDGQAAKAVAFYERSLAADPGFARNHLSLAAAYLECGKDAEACVHLARYAALHPEQLAIRRHYAELLLRLERRQEASDEFAALIAAAQEHGDEALGHLIYYHTRLMELAEAQDDDYHAHLHRGIGLYLLACERTGLVEPDDGPPSEGLLCKAAGELSVAHSQSPAEARPCWYLLRHLGTPWPAAAGSPLPPRGCRRGTIHLPFAARTAQLAARVPRLRCSTLSRVMSGRIRPAVFPVLLVVFLGRGLLLRYTSKCETASAQPGGRGRRRFPTNGGLACASLSQRL
jgi:hypothetical protein